MLHAGKEGQAENGEENIGGPNALGGGEQALTRLSGADDGEQIIGGDENDGEERAGGAAAAARARAERHGDESKDKAGHGKSQAAMKLDASFAPVGVVNGEKLAEGFFGIAELARLGRNEAEDINGPVALAEGGDGVAVGDFAGEFVSGAALEMELQLALPGLGNYNRILRQGDLGAAISAGFREKNAVPLRAAGRNVVDVENQLGETLVKDARLDGERDLRGEEAGFESAVFVYGFRAEPKRHAKSKSRAGSGENADGQENAAAADAESGEGDDFAVGGHAAETQEDANQDGHGQGEGEDTGQEAEKEFEDLTAGAGVADEERHQANELRDEQNEGENGESEERVAENFTNDIAVQNAHGANRECNTGARGARARARR